MVQAGDGASSPGTTVGTVGSLPVGAVTVSLVRTRASPRQSGAVGPTHASPRTPRHVARSGP